MLKPPPEKKDFCAKTIMWLNSFVFALLSVASTAAFVIPRASPSGRPVLRPLELKRPILFSPSTSVAPSSALLALPHDLLSSSLCEAAAGAPRDFAYFASKLVSSEYLTGFLAFLFM